MGLTDSAGNAMDQPHLCVLEGRKETGVPRAKVLSAGWPAGSDGFITRSSDVLTSHTNAAMSNVCRHSKKNGGNAEG